MKKQNALLKVITTLMCTTILHISRAYADGYIIDGSNWYPVYSCKNVEDKVHAVSCLDNKQTCGPYDAKKFKCARAISSCGASELFNSAAKNNPPLKGIPSVTFQEKTIAFAYNESLAKEIRKEKKSVIVITPPYATSLSNALPQETAEIAKRVFSTVDGCPPIK